MKYDKINHVGIVVKDWNEATDRYGKLFGIKHWYEIVTDEGTFDLKYHGEKRTAKSASSMAERARPNLKSSKRRAKRIFTITFTKSAARRRITLCI